MQATTSVPGGGRSVFERSPAGRVPDQVLQFGLAGIAAGVLILLGAFFVVLVVQSSHAISHIGIFNFLFHNNFDTSQLNPGAQCAIGKGCTFGAWPMVLGTLLTAGVALVIGVPIAVATALFLTELCPPRARTYRSKPTPAMCPDCSPPSRFPAPRISRSFSATYIPAPISVCRATVASRSCAVSVSGLSCG